MEAFKNSRKALLDDLQITLDSLKPIVYEMRDCNDELDPSCKEIAAFHSKIEEGVKLVCKLSTVDKWYKNRTCIKQLVELNGSLKTHIKFISQRNRPIRDLPDCSWLLHYTGSWF
ncbi:uncharacterized protein LOC126594346 isoform X2 [Malus sylvestris]|uniref:uncharacterized protein LOC126594346 isoform X2 n=1 Tax=Malus sylvestris TaxID=3752 RepID=UPI0021AC6CAF|nr:uncharacterized protein LOC126594346 isoform X2 [Malus sylvestris]